MHERAYPPRVMKALRDFVETKPKNVSLSEDNGYWMPQGSRFEIKVCPRDSAVPTDWRHRWSKKWTWSLWPMGNVPGTWIWMIDEDGVAPSDMYMWPGEARPILAVSYICPTETYKAAQQASICYQVQSGRKHSHDCQRTCATCPHRDPPRETESTDDRAPGSSTHPLREDGTDTELAFCLTRVVLVRGSGTCMAPSQKMPLPISSKIQNMMEGGFARDKRERIGEAANPGPEPPRELYLDRKNGQRDPIRLCKQNGGWVWNVHSVPPLRVAKKAHPPRMR